MPPNQEMSTKRVLRSARGEALRQAYIDDGGWEKVDGWLYLKALRLTDYIDKLGYEYYEKYVFEGDRTDIRNCAAFHGFQIKK